MSPRPLLLIAPVILILSACQQAAWKAGASADDLKRDEQACAAQTPEDTAAIKQCLRGKGWTVAEFAAPAESEGATLADAPAASPQPVAPPLHPAVRTPDAEAAAPVTSITTAGEAEKKASATAAAAANAQRDPLQRQSVQTWWKAGAQAADFKTDESACLQQLGAPHTPDYAKRLYTRAMVSCLRARGWFAGQDPTYTPLR